MASLSIFALIIETLRFYARKNERVKANIGGRGLSLYSKIDSAEYRVRFITIELRDTKLHCNLFIVDFDEGPDPVNHAVLVYNVDMASPKFDLTRMNKAVKGWLNWSLHPNIAAEEFKACS